MAINRPRNLLDYRENLALGDIDAKQNQASVESVRSYPSFHVPIGSVEKGLARIIGFSDIASCVHDMLKAMVV